MSSLLNYTSKRSPLQNSVIGFAAFFLLMYVLGTVPTQWFAWKYGYASNLGESLFNIGRHYFYMPTDWVVWSFNFGDIVALRTSAHILTILGLSSFLLAGVAAILFTMWLHKYSGGMQGLHGTSHWAEKAEIDTTGFVAAKNYMPTGVVIGSVILDRKNKVIHPHHPKYNERYKFKYKKSKGFFNRSKELDRDSDGKPKYEINKHVVKKIEMMRDSANTHLFGFAPTRSGKGVALLIPTLLTWANSVMVNDPKGEAFSKTAGFRKRAGQLVVKFNPASDDGTGACWNPLDEIRKFTLYDVQDAQMIMSIACDPKGEGLNDYFDKAGYEFLMGLALHVAYAERKGSLQGIAEFLGDPRWENDTQMYTAMINAVHDPEGKSAWLDNDGQPTNNHPIVANVAKTMLNKEDKDRSGVLSTAKALLSLYLDPLVGMNTNRSDFLMRDIMTSEKPVSLYLIINEKDIDRMVPLTRLFYALFIRRNATDMKFENGDFKQTYNFSLLMLIDEMPLLRKLPIIQEALGYVAGYGIRMFMLAQDIAQIEEINGDKQTIDSGASTRIVFAPNKIETAEKLANMSGKTTITEEKVSHSHDKVGLKGGSVSINTEKIERDLMTKSEFMSLHDHDMVIFSKGQPPIYARKAFYYENPEMVARTRIAPPAKTDFLRQAVESKPGAFNPTNVLAARIVDEQNNVNSQHEEWNADRNDLRVRINAMLQTENSDSSSTNESVDQQPGKEKKPPGSAYLKNKQILSEDERREINEKTNDLSLYQKVVALSAFE